MGGTEDRTAALADDLDRRLADADADLLAHYPGDRGVRQPVHTVYVPGDRFDADTVTRWGAEATAALTEMAGLGLDSDEGVLDRVRAKLEREPIEDLRIDFEDGYGVRPDDRGGRRRRLGGACSRVTGAGGWRVAVQRDPDQVLRGPDAASRSAHARPVRG
ncbi:DUF6986 family protein [Nocardioides sp. B-3]|uniref:DUF6986 family protein n=1 Tax=Nocardioides sp. B-3 TaxID=2895565 RepID=UPI00215379FC|nr:hypothetical protein [Nocardioides sp. B-3]UUZ58681.1 hypothetical protein LP418_21585 [Nocardioides sp. B-3]